MNMIIEIGYDIGLTLRGADQATLLLGALHVHPTRESALLSQRQWLTPTLPQSNYTDRLGNRIARVAIPTGVSALELHFRGVIADSGQPDEEHWGLTGDALNELPDEVLHFLLPSRYCDFDGPLLSFAWSRFAQADLGWARVRAICDYVHQHIQFDYARAKATRTATQAWQDGVGVCRDFAHLAVALCRSMNIPARYATGYLGDIGVPPQPDPMDFSAWFQVYLGGAWRTWDARHNTPRIGRVLMATGRDAADVPIFMVFGDHELSRFDVITQERTNSTQTSDGVAR